jgi:hypothetical protein
VILQTVVRKDTTDAVEELGDKDGGVALRIDAGGSEWRLWSEASGAFVCVDGSMRPMKIGCPNALDKALPCLIRVIANQSHN